MILLMIWTVLLLGVAALYFRRVYSRFSRFGVKTLPTAPVFGTMSSVVFRKEHFAEYEQRIYKTFPGERFVGSFEFISPIVIVKDLNLIKNVVIRDFEHFLDHRAFVDKEMDPFMGRNLFFLQGQEWKDMRSTMSPAFTTSKIRMMLPLMEEVGEQMLTLLQEQMKSSESGYIDVEVKDLLTRHSCDVIGSCAFGIKVDSHRDRSNHFYTAGVTIPNLSFKQILLIFAYTSFPTFVRLLKFSVVPKSIDSFIRGLVLNTMKDREERNIIRHDMIHLLMEAKKGKLKNEEKDNDVDTGFATAQKSNIDSRTNTRVWTDEDLAAQAFGILIAALDTASTAMTFLLHELALNPEVQDRLLEEIREFDARNGGKLDYATVQGMKYLDMVVSEVLRLWPPLPMLDRHCTKNYNLGKPNDHASQEYTIKAGEGIHIPTFAIHRDPQYYPDPLKFDPERFSDENKHNIKPFTYMPFGLGPRNCIGSRFALIEIKALACQLLRTFEVTPNSETQIPVRLSKNMFTVKAEAENLRFRARKLIVF